MPEEKDAKEQQEQQQIIQSGSVTTETNGKHIIHWFDRYRPNRRALHSARPEQNYEV